jgi:hypothetical protein
MTEQTQFPDRLRSDLRSIEDKLTPKETFLLQQARHKALARAARSKFSYFWPSLSSVLAASILLALLLLDRNIFQPQAVDDDQNLAIDLAVYLESDDELDVYYWLAESEDDLNMLYAYFE